MMGPDSPVVNVTYQYRMVGEVPYADADHANHPAVPHNCRCVCADRLAPWCKEHGEQVPKERRAVRTERAIGEWEPVPTDA